MILTRERLRLRPLRPEDAGWIARGIANRRVHRWLTAPPYPYRLPDAQDFIAKFGDEPGIRAIEAGGTGLGVISIAPADPDAPDDTGLPELGYWLIEQAWGRGYMTEAATRLLAWHDETVGGPVYSGHMDGNAGSEAVLRKLGFGDFETVSRHAHFHRGPVTIHRLIRQPSLPG